MAGGDIKDMDSEMSVLQKHALGIEEGMREIW